MLSFSPLPLERGRGGGGGGRIQTSDRSERRDTSLFQHRLLSASLCVCVWVCESGRELRSTLKSISFHNYFELLIRKSLNLYHLCVYPKDFLDFTLLSNKLWTIFFPLKLKLTIKLISQRATTKTFKQWHAIGSSTCSIIKNKKKSRTSQLVVGQGWDFCFLWCWWQNRWWGCLFWAPLSVSDAFQFPADLRQAAARHWKAVRCSVPTSEVTAPSAGDWSRYYKKKRGLAFQRTRFIYSRYQRWLFLFSNTVCIPFAHHPGAADTAWVSLQQQQQQQPCVRRIQRFIGESNVFI